MELGIWLPINIAQESTEWAIGPLKNEKNDSLDSALPALSSCVKPEGQLLHLVQGFSMEIFKGER